MTRRPPALAEQLSFDALLTDAIAANDTRLKDRQFGHLPATVEEALPFFHHLIGQHHKAMLEGEAQTVAHLREQAHDLATKLNNYEPGIIADDDAPGCRLAALTRAKGGDIPLWGQCGSFEIRHGMMRVRIEMDGLFGIGASHMAWLGFSAHAVEKGSPFLSDTGYRSFLGVGGALEPGFTPERFASAVVAAFVELELKGRLQRIVPLTAIAGRRKARFERA